MIEYISITDASTETGTPRSTLKKWCAAGHIRGALKIGSQWALPSNWTKPQLRRGNPNWQPKRAYRKQRNAQKEEGK